MMKTRQYQKPEMKAVCSDCEWELETRLEENKPILNFNRRVKEHCLDSSHVLVVTKTTFSEHIPVSSLESRRRVKRLKREGVLCEHRPCGEQATQEIIFEGAVRKVCLWHKRVIAKQKSINNY